MNRSGLTVGRILTNCCFKKYENFPPAVLLTRNYHHVESRNQILKFSPSQICLEPNRRFFFSTKDVKAEVDGAKESTEEDAKEVSEAEKALQEKLSELEEKNSDLLDKYRRSLADFENLRNRMNKQVGDAKIFGIQGFCKVVELSVTMIFCKIESTITGSPGCCGRS